jgi:predicted transcriptional regulator of viral defense system
MDIVDLTKRERQVISHLKDESRSWLDLRRDADWLDSITDSPKDLVYRLRQKGVLHTVQRGRYVLNLNESASRAPRLRSLEPLAEAVLGRIEVPYYISWHSALWHHGLVDQQSRQLYVAVTVRKRSAAFGPWRIRFVTVRPRKFFGAEGSVVEGTPVWIASVEKAIIDSFDQPQLAAHPAIVANALRRAWDVGKLDADALADEALRFESPTLNRRLGFFMEQFDIPGAERLRAHIGRGYSVPLARGWKQDVEEGHVDTRWGVVVDDELVYAAGAPK